jgi:uncharacterized protein YpmB
LWDTFFLQTLSAENAITFEKEEGSVSMNFKIHRENALKDCFLVKVKDQKISQISFSNGVTEDSIRDYEKRGFFKTIAEGSIGNLPFYCLVFVNRKIQKIEVFRIHRDKVIITKKIDEGVSIDLRIDEKIFLGWFGLE